MDCLSESPECMRNVWAVQESLNSYFLQIICYEMDNMKMDKFEYHPENIIPSSIYWQE